MAILFMPIVIDLEKNVNPFLKNIDEKVGGIKEF